MIGLFLINQSIRDSMIVAVRNTFSHAERIYNGQAQTILSVVVSWIFRVGVTALFFYLWLYNHLFSFFQYIQVAGIVACVSFIQHLLILGAGWIFLSKKQITNSISLLEVFRSFMCVIMLLLLIFYIHINTPSVYAISFLVIFIAFGILLWAKSIQLYFNRIISLLYILLYFTCLEIIPTATMYLWTQRILL